MKIVFADPKTGQCFQKEVEKEKEGQFYGKKIGDEFEGGLLGLPGYALKITGGSNKEGTPLVKTIPGPRKTQMVRGYGVGVRAFKKGRTLKKGEKRKKTLAGDTVSESTVQLNARVMQAGGQSLEQLGFVVKAKGEKKPEESKAEEVKPKAEGKKEAKPAKPEGKLGKPEGAEAKPGKEARAEGKKEEKPAEEKGGKERKPEEKTGGNEGKPAAKSS